MKITDSIALRWEGPFRIAELIQPSDRVRHLDCAGVYLWCDSNPRSICYVGKHKSSMIARQREHYLYQLSLAYSLPADARKCNRPWTCDWRKPEVLSTVLDQQQVLAHAAEAFDYVHSVDIYLAQLDPGLVQRVERQLGWALQPTGTVPNTRTSPAQPVAILHTGAEWITALRADRRLSVQCQ